MNIDLTELIIKPYTSSMAGWLSQTLQCELANLSPSYTFHSQNSHLFRSMFLQGLDVLICYQKLVCYYVIK